MDIEKSMDQYEKQLYTLFESYDTEHSGSLSREDLTELCESLQLEERGRELVNLLLGDSLREKVDFQSFRDGLLSVLGADCSAKKPKNVADKSEAHSSEDSSGREISPKFTFGSKKYGRRSRPSQLTQSVESFYSQTIQETDNSSLETFDQDLSVTSSVSHERLLVSKKRRPNNKVKRSISLTSHSHTHRRLDGDTEEHSASFSLTPMFDEVAKNIETSTHKYTTHSLTPDRLLLETSYLDCNSNSHIPTHQLFECTNANDEGSCLDVIPDANINISNPSATQTSDESMPSSNITDMWESAGVCQPVQLLHDLGFQDSTCKLPELIKVLEEEIRMMGNNHQTSPSSQLTTLLQATMCLYQYVMKDMKTSFTQTCAERDKLKCDVLDANQRAVLLAQEVDENHFKMESEAKENIKHLELKYADVLKTLTSQLIHEKEQASAIICNLEKKVTLMESEETKLKSHITSIEAENSDYEKCLANLQEQLSEMNEVKTQLLKDIKSLTSLKNYSLCTSSPQNIDIDILEKKIAQLQNDNIVLRDKNDELCAELEHYNITKPLDKLTVSKASCDVNIIPDVTFEDEFANIITSVTHDESFNANEILKMEDIQVSPTSDACNIQNEIKSFALSDTDGSISEECATLKASSLSTGLLNSLIEDNLKICSLPMNQTDAIKMEETIKETENLQFFFHHSKIQIRYLMLYCLLQNINADISNILQDNNITKDKLINKDGSDLLIPTLSELRTANWDEFADKLLLNNKNKVKQSNDNDLVENIDEKDLLDSQSIESEHLSNNELVAKVNQLNALIEKERKLREDEKSRDQIKCNELEVSVDLLRNEYEKCEEYWSSKLDEEREIFDQEQRMSDEKFTELVSKVAEYEEQFASQDNKYGALSTIEEKYNLEKQFTDLEEEYEDYKDKTDKEMNLKDKEINQLKEKLENIEKNNIALQLNDSSNKIVFSDKNHNSDVIQNNVNQFSELKISVQESDTALINGNDLTDDICSPIDYLWNQKTIPSLLPNTKNIPEVTRDYQNPVFKKDQKTETISEMFSNNCVNSQKIVNPIQKPLSPKSNSDKSNGAANNISHLGGKMLHCSELEETLQGRRQEVQRLEAARAKLNAEVKALHSQRITPQQIFGNLEVKSSALERHCRQLQDALRQQQSYAEAVMQQTIAAHRGEIGALRQRLAAADLLVRDLYVENCHLARSLTAPSSH